MLSKVKGKILENELVKDIRKVLSFMKKTGIRLPFFAMSLFFSFGLVMFNLYTVSLLFPLVQGIIKSDFTHVKNLKIVGPIIGHFPDLFHSSLALFIILVLWVYLNIILKNALQYAASVSTQYQAKNATAKMRDLLFDRCISFGKSFYDKNKLSFIHQIVTQSTKTIENQFKNLQGFIIEIFLILMYAFLMFRISWKLTLVSIVFFPIINIATKKIINKIQIILKQSETLTDDLSSRVYNILYCLPLVKGFVKEEYEMALYQEASKKEIDSSYKMQKVSSLISPIQDIGSTTSLLLFAFGMALVIYLDKSFNPANAFVFFYLAQNLNPRLNSINNFQLNMIQSSKAIGDLNSLLEENDEHIIHSGNKVFGGLKNGIEIKNLNFSYDPSGQQILNNVNMIIPKGKITAIVGPTGSGKSTLANLLLRFYDCPANSIFLDGVDIKDFDPKTIRKYISSVTQDNIFFNDTIKHNLLYGSGKEVLDEDLEKISQKVLVHDFVEKMPKKYATVIGERGTNLSGGEKQRISIARALIKDHDIFIMDEGTSALDNKTEQKIIETIDESLQGKTAIVISHRLSIIKKADNIIYLDHGSVKESGTLDELLALGGDFHKQWMTQKI